MGRIDEVIMDDGGVLNHYFYNTTNMMITDDYLKIMHKIFSLPICVCAVRACVHACKLCITFTNEK